MKNFSVNTADFDSLSISGESPIVQSDLGTAPNQIPLNKDLGSLAYMNAPQIEDLNVDTLELREIAAEMSETAVDVFVYDTRRDSDGGAWRNRTQHTSWYNEELNTATRGGRREFPAVAVIVAESDKVTIYDGDDPDLNMWMVFEQEGSTAGTANLIGPTQASLTSVFMLNGIISITENTWSVGLITANFISEGFIHYWETPKNYNGSISQRNDSMGYSAGDNEIIVNPYGNDVAMTVLPNAPIDADTGLPIPTIAVATDGGVSVIRDDGDVVDSSILQKHERIYFAKDYTLITAHADSESSDGYRVSDYPLYNNQGFSFSRQYRFTQSTPSIISDEKPTSILGFSDHVVGGCSAGLNYFLEDKINNSSGSNVSYGNGAYITSRYNTGWMPGDIKLATLSDTKNETVGEGNNPQLVTNGQFNSDVSGWTNLDPSGSPDATITWSNGTAQVFRPTGQNGRFYQAIDTIVGAEYFIQIGNYGGSSGGVFVADSDDPSSWNIIANNGAVIKDNNKHYFTATTTSTYIVLNNSLENQSVTFDNISVKRSGELITNGTFDDGTVGWTDASSNWSAASGQASSSGTGSLTQAITTIVGETYTISIDAVTIVSPYVRVVVGGAVPVQLDVGYTGTKAGTFTATSTSTTIQINPYASGQTIDNISVRLAEPDRSVNDNGLQIFGEIDKTPVAPGADLVAYSGFSEDNYLVQPYNSDLLDIDSHAVIGWCKVDSTTTEQTFLTFKSGGESDYTTSYTWTLMGCTSDGSLFIQTVQNGTSNFLKNGIVENTGSWHHFCFIVSGSELVIYKDGVFVDSEPRTTSGSLYLSDSELRIGVRRSSSSARWPAHSTSLSLIRLSTTIPTAEQIAKIYRDEKVLFQDGAQATLYGTSDAVTALAYDDKTELLHVGTSGGRSDFAGLRRINNTTTAVTTSISASNNLIAEQ